MDSRPRPYVGRDNENTFAGNSSIPGRTQLRILLTDEKVAEKFVFMVLNLRPKEQIRSELQIVSRLT